MPEPLLSVRGLCKYFPVYRTGFFRRQIGTVKACDDVSFDLAPGETLGLVGESGCGKTTTGRAILRALRPTRGQVLFRPHPAASRQVSGAVDAGAAVLPPAIDLATLSHRELKPLRTQLQMIFQDPYSSLNPRMTVRDIVGEPLVIHGLSRGAALEDRVAVMLRRVGLKPEHRTRYPHAFSGGQRQRIGIARALILNPSLVVCDEAVSALDVSVQAQVINLLRDLQEEFGLTYLFIAHDLSVVRHISDRIAVMYAGRIVEMGPAETVFRNPRHPYTQALLAAVPNPDPDVRMAMPLTGDVADPGDLPPGCAFHPRCRFACTLCRNDAPPWRDIEPGRAVRCHLAAPNPSVDAAQRPGAQ